MTSMIVFDDGKARLGPMTDLRPVFDIRTGAMTTRQRLTSMSGANVVALAAPEELAPLVSQSESVPVNAAPDVDAALVVSGRCVIPPEGFDSLEPGSALVEEGSGCVIAAHLRRGEIDPFLATFVLPEGVKTVTHEERCLLRHPEDVVRFRDRAIEIDLSLLTQSDGASQRPCVASIMGSCPVTIDPSAQVAPMTVLDAQRGPIVIDEGASIRPGAIVCGPAYIGKGSTIIDRAHIKPNTAIGPACKVGGEVGGTIFQGCSNKAHDGHLGDAWVGEWVNFGAGTINSNLLNTYGQVSMRTGVNEPRRRTGMTFLGAIVGDHVRFAIATRLMTGSVIGTGAMIASSAPAPATVDRFSWITDRGCETYRLDRFLASIERMMIRRDVKPSEALITRLGELHAMRIAQTSDAKQRSDCNA